MWGQRLQQGMGSGPKPACPWLCHGSRFIHSHFRGDSLKRGGNSQGDKRRQSGHGEEGRMSSLMAACLMFAFEASSVSYKGKTDGQ